MKPIIEVKSSRKLSTDPKYTGKKQSSCYMEGWGKFELKITEPGRFKFPKVIRTK